jgi:class 3 adenylate cyclase
MAKGLRPLPTASSPLPELDVPQSASHDHGHMRRDLPSGAVTFLFTDVEGSTKLLHQLGAEAYAEQLAVHRRVVRKACIARGGVEVDTQGDAFFIAFPSAPDALEAAHAITKGLAAGPITLRIGLHTGTPLLTEEGYIGEDVHFAARVAASAHGGQVVLSQATRALIDEGYPLVDLGEHRLKDIPEPVDIFQLGDGRFPPLKTISNTNLPRPASSFVGRERELRELLARIADGSRLVTLTGPGAPERRGLQSRRPRRSSRSTRRASSGSGSLRYATLHLSPSRSRRRSVPRTGSPTTSANARCSSSSTTSNR